MKRYVKTKRHIYKRFPEDGYIMNEEGVGVTNGSPELNPLDEEIIRESDDPIDVCDVFILEYYWPAGRIKELIVWTNVKQAIDAYIRTSNPVLMPKLYGGLWIPGYQIRHVFEFKDDKWEFLEGGRRDDI